MKATKGFPLFLVLTVLVGSVVVFTLVGEAQTNPVEDEQMSTDGEGQTIHCLWVVADQDPKLALRTQRDLVTIDYFMKSPVQKMINKKMPSAKINASELHQKNKGYDAR